MITALLRIDKRDLLTAFLAVIAIFSFVPIFTYLFFAQDLISKESIMNKNNTGVVLLDRNGKVFFRFYEAKYLTYTLLVQSPKYFQEAITSAFTEYFSKGTEPTQFCYIAKPTPTKRMTTLEYHLTSKHELRS